VTSSTYYSSSSPPAYGRLYDGRGDGWCAATATAEDWLQVDFGKTVVVCAVATQGDWNGNEWVTDFKLSYSSEGSFWNWYTDRNGAEVVSFNSISNMRGLMLVIIKTMTMTITMTKTTTTNFIRKNLK